MKHIFTVACAAFLSIVLFTTSCKKGDAGPQGPEGPEGPQGPRGDTGVANVIYSDWFDVNYSAGVDTTSGDTVLFYTQINIPKLSNAILSTGEMKMFVNWGTAAEPNVDPLPLHDIYFGVSITTTYSLQSVLLLANGNFGTVTSGGNKFQQYRYILIPGGVKARSSVDWNNYEAVKKYLGLKD